MLLLKSACGVVVVDKSAGMDIHPVTVSMKLYGRTQEWGTVCGRRLLRVDLKRMSFIARVR